MRIPVIQGVIKRRMLVNFRADPKVVQGMLPQPFRPKLHKGHSLVGICLIRLESIRPKGLPGVLGLSSENAAHRIAVQWRDAAGIEKEGVYIPRRDTSSLLNRIAGGRFFPGEHHSAQFSVTDIGGQVELNMRAIDGAVTVQIKGADAGELPTQSCFSCLSEASKFFEGGSLGYSPAQGGRRLDALLLRTLSWRVRAFRVQEVHSSFFGDRQRFPEGSVQFDHALIMRDIPHEWHGAEELVAA